MVQELSRSFRHFSYLRGLGYEINFLLGGVAASFYLFLNLSDDTLVYFYWSSNIFNILGELERGESFSSTNLGHMPIIHILL